MDKKKQFPWLKGIQSILITPLNHDQSLDLEGLRKIVDFGARSSAHILVALGTQGEFYGFDSAELRDIIRVSVETNAHRKPMIVGTSCAGTIPTLELTRYAKDVGADAVMITPPYYVKVGLEEVYRHFAVLNEVGIPIDVYNNPARQGYNMPPEFLARLAELENVVAIKQATNNVVELQNTIALLGDKLQVFGGSESFIFAALALGFVGSSSTASSCFPDVFVSIYDHMMQGDFASAKAIFDSLEPFRKVCNKFGAAATVKHACELIGLPGGPMRYPLPTPNEAQCEEIDAALKTCGLIP